MNLGKRVVGFLIALSLVCFGCSGGQKHSDVLGAYKIVEPKKMAEDAPWLRLTLLEQGRFELGDPEMPKSLIKGSWRQADSKLYLDLETVAGRPAAEVPRTKSTKLNQMFLISREAGVITLTEENNLWTLRFTTEKVKPWIRKRKPEPNPTHK